eukprot:Rmarinus@m.20807
MLLMRRTVKCQKSLAYVGVRPPHIRCLLFRPLYKVLLLATQPIPTYLRSRDFFFSDDGQGTAASSTLFLADARLSCACVAMADERVSPNAEGSWRRKRSGFPSSAQVHEAGVVVQPASLFSVFVAESMDPTCPTCSTILSPAADEEIIIWYMSVAFLSLWGGTCAIAWMNVGTETAAPVLGNVLRTWRKSTCVLIYGPTLPRAVRTLTILTTFAVTSSLYCTLLPAVSSLCRVLEDNTFFSAASCDMRPVGWSILVTTMLAAFAHLPCCVIVDYLVLPTTKDWMRRKEDFLHIDNIDNNSDCRLLARPASPVTPYDPSVSRFPLIVLKDRPRLTSRARGVSKGCDTRGINEGCDTRVPIVSDGVASEGGCSLTMSQNVNASGAPKRVMLFFPSSSCDRNDYVRDDDIRDDDVFRDDVSPAPPSHRQSQAQLSCEVPVARAESDGGRRHNECSVVRASVVGDPAQPGANHGSPPNAERTQAMFSCVIPTAVLTIQRVWRG